MNGARLLATALTLAVYLILAGLLVLALEWVAR